MNGLDLCRKIKVMVCFGTRPEAIKMCPLVLELKKHQEIECIVCVTGQHKEMLKQVLNVFRIQADYNLDIMKNGQTLTEITTNILEGIEPVLIKEKPDLVLVHGDTSTSFSVAVAAFYQKIPVGHVEAGLRTYNIYSPYPEEMNRLLVDRISEYHYSPTAYNIGNLEKENIKGKNVLTGNTVIDSFQYTVRKDYVFSCCDLNEVDFSKKVIVVTAHRRENLGEPLQNICNAIKKLALQNSDMVWVYPAHLNRIVQETVRSTLSDIENVFILPPLDVFDMHNLLCRSYFVMTDSGGLQEEAPHFGKPVLVLRDTTERPEAVKAGTVKVVGTNMKDITDSAQMLLDDEDEYNRMARAVNPYGDGHASERIVEDIISSFCDNDVK